MPLCAASPGSVSSGEQPFQCQTCSRRFTRRENLKRHEALHSQASDGTAYSCPHCSTHFSRVDLRLRHIRRKHPGVDKRGRLSNTGGARTRTSVEPGVQQTSAVDPRRDSFLYQQEHGEYRAELDPHDYPVMSSPDRNLHRSPRRELTVTSDALSDDLSIHSPNAYPTFEGYGPMTSPNSSSPYADEIALPTPAQVMCGVQLFFDHVAPGLPVIHQPTFNIAEAPQALLLSMLSLGYHHGDDPDCNDPTNSGPRLALRCFSQARLLAASHDPSMEDLESGIALVQAHLFLQISAVMYFGGSLSRCGLEVIRSQTVTLARSLGMTQFSCGAEQPDEDSSNLDDLWRGFIVKETRGRTLIAIHQADSLWYQVLSVPRALSHLEIKVNMPCEEALWNAGDASQWAYHRLRSNQNNYVLNYHEAIRQCLSAGEVPSQAIPTLGQYGVISITHFLLSSVREASGWATMSGKLSLDRFVPLRTSLIALERHVRPPQHPYPSTRTSLICEATWEMAMIELQLWSLSHTRGVIHHTLEAMLQELTHQVLTHECLTVDEEVARTIQPHLDWFLMLLDSRPEVVEAPIVLLYAYKAVLFAWQLLRRDGAESGVVHVLGLDSVDLGIVVEWAHRRFAARSPQYVVEQVLKCLDMLRDAVF